MTESRLAFVGAGRLARVLAPALQARGYSVLAVASRSLSSAQELAGRLPDAQALTAMSAAAAEADIVFLTVPDDAIGDVAARIAWRKGQAAVHCSGALELDVLDAAARAGARTGCFHPLQTFASEAAPLAGFTVAIESADEGLAGTLSAMAEALGCRPFRVPAGKKALYHAAAAMASNYLVTLLAEAAGLWWSMGQSRQDALQALLPLVQTTLANVERLGPEAALTGPIARGDAGTVRRHLHALEEAAPDVLPLYKELGRCTLGLARLEPVVETELATILSKEKQPCV